MIARAERVARRRRFAAPDETRQLRPSAGLATPVGGKCVQAGLRNTESRLSAGQRTAGPGRLGKPAAVPIIIVQCELFFDARRLSPAIPPELLAGFAACCASSAQFGRLIVPGWGANTMRAEFAVLTGIPESELGYDRFNPITRWRGPRSSRMSGGCAGPATARSVCTRSIAASSAATWRCRRSGSSTFSVARRSAGRAPRPIIADPDLAARHPADRRSRGTGDLPLRDHDGQSRPLAEEGTADRPRYRRPVRSGRDAGRGRSVALSRRAETLRRDAADPDRRIGAARQTGRGGILRRPSAEPAARLRAFRLHRDIVRLCDLERRQPRPNAATFRRTSSDRPRSPRLRHRRPARTRPVSPRPRALPDPIAPPSPRPRPDRDPGFPPR